MPLSCRRATSCSAASRRISRSSAEVTSAARLVTRPLEHTLERTLAWEEGRDAPRACGLTDAQERQLREVLDARGVR